MRMNKWANILLACTITQALSNLRPGAMFFVDLTSSTWIQTNDPNGVPDSFELISTMFRCEQNLAKTSSLQIQNDIFNIQNSTNTVDQQVPALIDLLNIKGLLQ